MLHYTLLVSEAMQSGRWAPTFTGICWLHIQGIRMAKHRYLSTSLHAITS